MNIRAMRSLLAFSIALMLLLTSSASLYAQERPEVAVTFELTLKGTAPTSVAFGAFFETCGYDGNCIDLPSGVAFCTSSDMTNVHYGIPGFGTESRVLCEEGEVYHRTVIRYSGDLVPYYFHINYKNQDGRNVSEGFFKGTTRATDDIVISAVYDFGDSDEQREDGQMPEAPPDVGGGGMSEHRTPPAPPARSAVGGSSIAYAS